MAPVNNEEEEEGAKPSTGIKPPPPPPVGRAENNAGGAGRGRRPHLSGHGGAGEHNNRAFSQPKSLYFGIPSNQETREHAEVTHGENSWRFKVVAFIHTPLVQKLLMGLLALDVGLLFLEMFLLATFPHCSVIERDAVSCCPNLLDATMAANLTTAAEDTHAERWLRFLSSESSSEVGAEEEFSEQHSLCAHDYYSTSVGAAACDEHKWRAVHVMEDAIFGVTLCILSLFWIELNVMMVALGPVTFYSQFFFTLDYLIVTISIVLECVFYLKRDEIYQSLAGLLVVVRLWRFFRIGHGIVEVTHELAQEEYHKLEYYKDELEELLRSHNIPLPASAAGHDETNGGHHHHSSGATTLPPLLAAVEQHHHRQSMIRSSTRSSGDGDAAAAEVVADVVEPDKASSAVAAAVTSAGHDAAEAVSP